MKRVNLVGIGPGYPGLLTMRAAEAIRAADVIRHPRGVDAAILGLARPGALLGELGDADEIVHLAKHDHRVTVLYFGDPFTFGEAAPLAESLSQAGVEFEAVPGVLIEAAGATISGVSPTVLGNFPAPGQTAALRVHAGRMGERVTQLLAAGHEADAPGVVIFNPGGPGQSKVMAPLRHLGGAAARGLDREVVLVVGPGVEATTRLDSLAGRPLHGRRVLVTRARHQAEEFHRHLADLGAWVIDIPTIEVRPLRVDAKTRDAVDRLGETQLVVFASANAVEIFFEMLFELRRDARALSASRLCAIGPETARTLEAHGLRPELVSGEYTAEGLSETLRNWDLRGSRILVPRARQNRDSLPAVLAKRGAVVEILPVYELACPAGAAPALRQLFASDPVDAVTFTSTATVHNFAGAFEPDQLRSLLERTRIACMGPVTADAARQLGMRVDIIAGEYTTRGLASAVAGHFNT